MGTHYKVRTDYDAPPRILIMTEATRKLACWRLRLSEFELHIVHRPGVKL